MRWQTGNVVARREFASRDAERRDIGATLNFVIPAEEMYDLLRMIEGGREAATRHVVFNTIEVPPDDGRTSY